MLFKASTYVLLRQITSIIASVISGLFVARYLGPSGKGDTFLFIQISAILSTILSLGLGPSITYHLRSRLISFAHSLRLLLFYLGCLFLASPVLTLVIYSVAISIGYSTGLFVVFIACLNATFIAANSAAGGIILRSDNGFGFMAIALSLTSVLYLLLLIYFVYFLSAGVLGSILATTLSSLASLIILAYPLLSSSFSDPVRRSTINCLFPPSLFSYGIGLSAANVLMTVTSRLDVFFLARLSSSSSVGIYSVAIALIDLALLIPSSIASTLFPYVSSLSSSAAIHTTSSVCRFSMYFILVANTFLLLFGAPTILFAFGSQFLPAAPLLPILSIGLIALSYIQNISSFFIGSGQPRLNLLLYSLMFPVALVSNALLVPSYAIYGAAAACAITYLSGMAVAFILVGRTHDSYDLSLFFLPQRGDLNVLLKLITR